MVIPRAKILPIAFVLSIGGCSVGDTGECRDDARLAAAQFAELVGAQQATLDEIESKYAAIEPTKADVATKQQLTEAIADDVWGMRFALQEFLPIESYPGAIYRWEQRLAEKNLRLLSDAAPHARMQVSLLETMCKLAPGSHLAASDYVGNVTRLWAATTEDEWDAWDQGVPAPAFPVVVSQLRATQLSFAPFGQALSDTIEHPECDATFERIAVSRCSA